MLENDQKSNEEILADGLQVLGLQPDVRLVDVHGFRWTLDYEQSGSHPDFGRNMIDLERYLQKKTMRPIDLRLEAESDKNRRIQRNTLWKKD